MKRIALILVAILILLMGIVVVACGGGKEATMPTPPLVTPRDAANITTAEAMLNGNLDDLGTAPSVNVSFVWGTTSVGPYPNETTPQAMNAPGEFSFDLTGLTPGTTYYFQAKAVGDGASYSIEKSLTTLTVPPTVTTSDVTNIIATGAMLNGNLDDLGTASSVNVSFVWGTTSVGPYPNETTPQAMNAPGAYSFDLTGLTPGTVYLQAKAVGDGTGYGVEKSFAIPVTFPDSNLEAAIREAINKPEGSIYTSDLEALTTLEAGERGISDLTGLEYCVNLRELVLYRNNISNISALAGLANLMSLDLSGNNISDISPMAGLTNLLDLDLGGNNISDISTLAGLTNLRGLDIWHNNISNFSPLADLTNLRGLGLDGNNISDISPLAGLTNLKSLDLSGNNISDISPLSGLTNLQGLWLTGNNINDISPLAGLTNLESLVLTNNNISDISPLAALTTLNWLDLVSNNISDISPLSGLTNLDWLPLGGNNISDISPLVANNGLSEEDFVSLEGNPLDTTSINVYIPQLIDRGVDVKH